MFCNGTGEDCVAIPEATSHSYKLAKADSGDEITVTVTATNLYSQRRQTTATPVGPITS